MAIGKLIKVYRKDIIVHILIIGGFLIYLFFFAAPLFDIIEKVRGESKLHSISLPAETNNIQYFIDRYLTNGDTIVEITGWAFIKDKGSANNQVYIVLKSSNRTDIFDTQTVIRPDVAENFKMPNLDLEYSGFTALIPARDIRNGKYTIGIYIRKGDVEALQYTNRGLVKTKDGIEIAK
jgi:hypothetical protein